jgi:hypothetical protein
MLLGAHLRWLAAGLSACLALGDAAQSSASGCSACSRVDCQCRCRGTSDFGRQSRIDGAGRCELQRRLSDGRKHGRRNLCRGGCRGFCALTRQHRVQRQSGCPDHRGQRARFRLQSPCRGFCRHADRRHCLRCKPATECLRQHVPDRRHCGWTGRGCCGADLFRCRSQADSRRVEAGGAALVLSSRRSARVCLRRTPVCSISSGMPVWSGRPARPTLSPSPGR